MAKKKKKKYYVVWTGRKPGIFTNWEECSAQVTGHSGAKFKSFDTQEAAAQAFRGTHKSSESIMAKESLSLCPPLPAFALAAQALAQQAATSALSTEGGGTSAGTLTIARVSRKRIIGISKPILESYSVDAACSGNPGPLEYRCVHTDTREVIFQMGPYVQGTNNIGEFLAIVHALALCKKKGINCPIYTDSETGIAWIRRKKCRTKQIRNERNAELFGLIERAEKWLAENEYTSEILKWETGTWGEIPADFGRK